MLWSRKPSPPVHDRSRHVGLDLTASRARAASVGGGKTRLVPLDGGDELPLVVNLDRRPADLGRTGVALYRKLPHAVATAFLPRLGQPHTWTAGRTTLTADAALALAFGKLRGPVLAESDAAALVLPAYLTPAQVAILVGVADKHKLPLRGTASSALAVVAHRAAQIVGRPGVERPLEIDPPDGDGGRPDWVVPIRPFDGGPGAVVVVDVDEYALSAAVILVAPGEVRQLAVGVWPKLGLKLWTDRLLDGLSDRCVRLCRRDPRDSADAEQALYEQLPDALGRAAAGLGGVLTVRSAHWYQDLPQRPADYEGYCAGLVGPAADAVRELAAGADLPAPPRAVWLSAAAARLPGLFGAVHRTSAERTTVEALPDGAAAEAAAALAGRWHAGVLARAHLDATIPVDEAADGPAVAVPYAQRAK